MGHAFYEELPPLQKLLLLAIADHANDDGYGAYPSQIRLAEKVGCGVRHIRNLTGTLESLGLVEIIQRGDGRGNTTHYLLPWAKNIVGRIKGVKAEPHDTKAEVQSSAEPSLEPSEDSEPPRQSEIDSSSPPLVAASPADFYIAESTNEQVAALVDIGKANGRVVRGGRVAALLTRYDKTAVIVAFMEAIARNVAVIEDYTEGVLRNGQEYRRGDQPLETEGRAGGRRELVAEGISEIITEEEARRLIAARASAEGGRGAGETATPNGERPLRER